MKKIKLAEVVARFLDGSDFGNAEYSKAYRIALRGLDKFNWDVEGVRRVVKLIVKPDLSAELPRDYLNSIKVGVGSSKEGELALLTRNDSLSQVIDLDVEYDTDISPLDFASVNNDHYLFPYVNKSLGVGSVNNIGEYSIRQEQGVILFNPEFCYSEVVMEYLASPTVEHGEYYINEMFSEALVSYIRWQWYIAKPIAVSQKQEYERQWYNELRKAKRRRQNITEAVLNDASRLSVKYAIKS